MKILVLNAGSSSLKYQLMDMDGEKVLAKGNCERIGIDGLITHKTWDGRKVSHEASFPTHTEAFQELIRLLTSGEGKVIDDISEINAVGQRTVHGGEQFSGSVLITDEVLKTYIDLCDLAPLHNPAGVLSIQAVRSVFGDKMPQVGVFDTAFHQTMPEEAYMYAIPYHYYKDYKIRRYGFHGTSHDYVSKRVAAVLEQPYESLKTIVCHLGNGASVSAVKNGRCIDTSMGLTPLEGLIMGTRSGDIDPAIVGFIARKEGKSIDEIMDILNKESGVYGLSDGFSSDFRDLEDAYLEGNTDAVRALKAFSQRVIKYIGAYAAEMDGVDAICFTAGLGENSPIIRDMVCESLSFLGISLDEEANHKRGEEIIISKPGNGTKVLVIPTNEELAIARETAEILKADSR